MMNLFQSRSEHGNVPSEATTLTASADHGSLARNFPSKYRGAGWSRLESYFRKIGLVLVPTAIALCPVIICASQATTTSISVTGQQAGATPFISKVSLTVSNISNLQSIQFT